MFSGARQESGGAFSVQEVGRGTGSNTENERLMYSGCGVVVLGVHAAGKCSPAEAEARNPSFHQTGRMSTSLQDVSWDTAVACSPRKACWITLRSAFGSSLAPFLLAANADRTPLMHWSNRTDFRVLAEPHCRTWTSVFNMHSCPVILFASGASV